MAKNRTVGAYVERLSSRATWAAHFLGGGGARGFIVLLVLGLLGYWLYATVWQPLTSAVPLPEGVSERDSMVDVGLLQSIGEQRASRVDFAPQPILLQGILTDPPINQ